MDECVCIQMTALSVGYIQTYRDSVDSLGESVDMSIKVQTYKVIVVSPKQFSFVLKRVGEHSVQLSAVVLYSLVLPLLHLFHLATSFLVHALCFGSHRACTL